MSPVIRLADEKDRAAVESLVAIAYGKYVARIGREPGPMLDDYGASIRERLVSVLDIDGTIEGLLVLIPERDVMLLDNIAVHPRAQGRGYGRILMEHAETRAIAEGYAAIRLYTHEMMIENIALYRHYGYAETHRAEEKNLPRVFMTKPLHLPLE